MNKILLILFLANSIASAQNVDMLGEHIVFGSSKKDFSLLSFWKVVEEDAGNEPYIKLFVGQSDSSHVIGGAFYEDNLVGIEVAVVKQGLHPTILDIEKLIIGCQAYMENDLSGGEYVKCFKTQELLIRKGLGSQTTMYSVYSIQLLNEVRKLHSEYLQEIF